MYCILYMYIMKRVDMNGNLYFTSFRCTLYTMHTVVEIYYNKENGIILINVFIFILFIFCFRFLFSVEKQMFALN